MNDGHGQQIHDEKTTEWLLKLLCPPRISNKVSMLAKLRDSYRARAIIVLLGAGPFLETSDQIRSKCSNPNPTLRGNGKAIRTKLRQKQSWVQGT